MRAVLVTNLPRANRIQLFNEVARRLAPEIDFSVLFVSDPSVHTRRAEMTFTLDGASFDHAFVSGTSLNVSYERVLDLGRGLRKELRRRHPGLVVTGGFGFPTSAALAYAIPRRIPLLLWSGAIGQEGDTGLLRHIARRGLLRAATASIVYGSAAARYVETLAPRGHPIVVAMNASSIEPAAVTELRSSRDEVRADLGIDVPTVLYVGRLAPKKGLELLVEALDVVRMRVPDVQLRLVGSGPLEESLRTRIAQKDLSGHVRWCGYLEGDALLRMYVAADVLAFPSLYDQWGIVMNEALACGLPVVASPIAGGTEDLVQDGVNGYATDPRDIDVFAGRLVDIVSNASLRARLSAGAIQVADTVCTLERSSDAFAEAIRTFGTARR